MPRCVDSAGWHNGARPGGALTCAMYVERGYCAGGRMTQHWTNGAAFRWPSNHCCACGKNASLPQLSSPQLGPKVVEPQLKNAPPPSLRLDASARHARDAWASLPGCEATPADPYSDAYLDRLVDRVRPRLRGRKLPWSAVMASFTHALQRSCFENLVLVSVYDGKVAAAACANTSVGALTHYREFKFALVSALAGLGPEGSKPPDVAFILDLTDRAAIRLKDDVPKLASSAGACAQSLPAPISLKGYGSNTWQEELRTPAFGGGAGWKWAHADWHAKDARAVWRGGVRSYGDCLQQTAQWSPTSCALRPCYNYSCFGQNDSAAAAAVERRACALSASSGTPTEYEHPRDRLLRSPTAAVEGAGDTLALDVGATACEETHLQHQCGMATLRRRGIRMASGVPFRELATGRAVLEVDGEGYQASLASKLTLGSAVLTVDSLFPLWYDDGDALLRDGEHLLRVRPDLSDLSERLRWLRAQSSGARTIADAGRRRACELLHGPNVAGYVGRLLQRYATLFDGPMPPQYHTRVSRRHFGGFGNRPSKSIELHSPEELWFRNGKGVNGRFPCEPWWIGDASCEELRAHKRAQFTAEGRGAWKVAWAFPNTVL